MNKELLVQYAQLKIQEKELQSKIKELAPQILKSIDDSGADKVELSEYGSFSLVTTKKWKYSEAVKTAETVLEQLQEKEKADGTATFEENKQLKFFALKENG